MGANNHQWTIVSLLIVEVKIHQTSVVECSNYLKELLGNSLALRGLAFRVNAEIN